MGLATRNALYVILVASTAVAALAALLWLDSLAFDWAGYSTGSNSKLFIAWLAATSAFLAWRMQIEPSELVWGLLVSATAMTFVFSVNATISYAGCPEQTTTIFYLAGPFYSACDTRSDFGSIAVWATSLSGTITAALAIFLPVVEMWDRTHAEQKE